jgi:hypothetical protein
MSPLLSETNPRLHAFFSSHLVMVDAVQSHGASLEIAAAASGAVLFGAAVAAFEPVALVAA